MKYVEWCYRLLQELEQAGRGHERDETNIAPLARRLWPADNGPVGTQRVLETLQENFEDLQALHLAEDRGSSIWRITDMGRAALNRGATLLTAVPGPVPTPNEACIIRAINDLSEHPEATYAWVMLVPNVNIFLKAGLPESARRTFGPALETLRRNGYLAGKGTHKRATCKGLLWQQTAG
jgi:hypothetical protein